MTSRKAKGRWSPLERENHINYLELLAVYRAIMIFRKELHNKVVSLQLDNVTAASYLVKEGGTRSQVLDRLARQILFTCRESTIHLRPAYLPRSRCFVKRQAVTRVGSESEGGKNNFQDIRKTSGRPLRITEVGPSATVFLNRQEGQEGLRGRRLGTDLEVPIDVCLPSTATDTYGFSQDQDDKSNTDFGSTFLAKGELVARVDRAVSREALSTSSSSIYSEEFDDREGLTIPFEDPPNSVAHISRAFKDQGVGEPLAEFICGSWRESTKVQYQSAWVSWCRWCDGQNV